MRKYEKNIFLILGKIVDKVISICYTIIYNDFNTLCVGVTEQGSNACAIGFAERVWNEYECTVEVIGNVYDNPELGCPMPNRNE